MSMAAPHVLLHTPATWLASAASAATDAAPPALANPLLQLGAIGAVATMAIGALAWIVRKSLAEKDELRAEVRELHKLRAADQEKFLPILLTSAAATERMNEASRELVNFGTRLVEAATDLEAAVRHRRD